MSYFAKPHFIPYDEWFADNLEKDEINFIHKRKQDVSNMHEFYYRKSNNKIGASENLLKLEIEEKSSQKLANPNTQDFLKNYFLSSKEKDKFFKKLSKNKPTFGISKYLFYRLWYILGFSLILGAIIFFISSTRENESNNNNKFLEIQKQF